MALKYKPTPYIETTFDRLYIDGHFEEAITYMEQFKKEYVTNPYGQMLAYIHIASCYLSLQQIDKAYSNMLEYKKLCDKFGSTYDVYQLFYMNTLIYKVAQNYVEAERCIKQCIQLAEQLHLQFELYNCYTIYSYILNISEKPELALQYAMYAKNGMSTHQLTDTFLTCQIYCNLANANVHLNRYTEAEHALQQIVNNPYIVFASREKSQYYYVKALLASVDGDLPVSISHFKKCCASSTKINDCIGLKFIYKNLAFTYEKMGDFKNAYRAIVTYSQLCEQLIHTQTHSNVEHLRLNHQVAIIEEQANIDYLSALYNRNYIETLCNEWLQCSKKDTSSIYCIAFDVDNFKEINDTYGHLYGDEVIKKIGEVCLDYIQNPCAIAGRYGGDEFVVLIRELNDDAVMKSIHSLFTSLSNSFIKIEQHTIFFTVSMGVVTSQKLGITKFKQLFKYADQALYIAKKQGKNQMVTLQNLQ